MKTVVLAYHNIGCVGIEALLAQGVDICAVFTHKDNPDENIWFASVAELAAANGIPVYAAEDINHPLWRQKIAAMAPDFLFSFYYRDLLGEELLKIPTKGCFNLHGSLLPRYRGRCPANWVLVHGEKETGVTLHKMEKQPDRGNIYGQQKVEIDENDTALTLHHKLAEAAKKLLTTALPTLLSGQSKGIPQNHSLASYFGGRSPKDGAIHWHKEATEIRNLIRAVTRPYPGAFSWLGDRKVFFWQATVQKSDTNTPPGTILTTHPLTISCGKDAIVIDFGQKEDSVYSSGKHLAQELNLAAGMRFSDKQQNGADQRKNVLILGVNGFIGNHLSERLLAAGNYDVYGMDLCADTLHRLQDNPHFHFTEGDIAIQREWIEYHVRKCDIIVPLVAIATPIEYVRNPLRVFELDFEENLRIVRYCAKYGKRLIFPSTSEVYGMCNDKEFDEQNSNFTLGPIHKQRWIYSCAKQMLDRVIWAYGATEGLDFTIFRPFNWIGPRLDSLESARIGSSRVITRFILDLVEGSPIQLVDGGAQKRCFTDVADGVECLFKIIENRDGVCCGQIFNIGNPDNEFSMKELAEILRDKFDRHKHRHLFPPDGGVQTIEAKAYYGKGYQDIQHRRPSIRQAEKLLGWRPQVPFAQSIAETLDYFLDDAVHNQQNNG